MGAVRKQHLDEFWVKTADKVTADEAEDGLPSLTEEEERVLRHDAMDKVFADNNLAPPPGKIGRWRDGMSEIIEVIEPVIKTRLQYFLTFLVKRWDGETEWHTLRFHANSAHKQAVIVLPIINGQLVMIRQFRLAVGRWCTEFPRSFADNIDQPSMIDHKLAQACRSDVRGRVPLGLLGKKLTPVFTNRDFTVLEIARLSSETAQDTGADTTCPEVWLVRLEVPSLDVRHIRGNKSMQPRFFDPGELRDSGTNGHPPLAARGIDDFLTLGAITLWQEYERMRAKP